MGSLSLNPPCGTSCVTSASSTSVPQLLHLYMMGIITMYTSEGSCEECMFMTHTHTDARMCTHSMYRHMHI